MLPRDEELTFEEDERELINEISGPADDVGKDIKRNHIIIKEFSSLSVLVYPCTIALSDTRIDVSDSVTLGRPDGRADHGLQFPP